MLVDFGRSNLVSKARQQPEKVRQVIQKAKTDGLLNTIESVRAKLDEPMPLGYCNVGYIQASPDSSGFKVGERVLSNGAHAEVVSVPLNLCARVPDSVESEEATFGVLGAIALQGIRLVNPSIGESIVVTGLGLIGLLAVQLLKANGCRVLGIDLDGEKCKLAASFGAEVVDLSKGKNPEEIAAAWAKGRGVDGVLITASTRSNEPVQQAARMCRKRGRIVLIGVTGLELNRADFYEKELSFQVSCSYGPGRYDPEYEERGQDYPYGFVRWTAQRNMEAFLDLLANERINVKPLISHRFPFERAPEAYELVAANKGLGIILEYSGVENRKPELERTIELNKPAPSGLSSAAVGLAGAGNFTRQVLAPALKETGARLVTIVSSATVSASHLGRKFGFERVSSETDTIFEDPSVNLVVITTRHNSHAQHVIRAIRAGKRVFVEKPLCLTVSELDDVQTAYREASEPFVMVGFNRRFSPFVVRMKSLLAVRQTPKAFVFTVNSGSIPKTHWVQDQDIGGGRIIGEACHFIDLLRFLAGARIVHAEAVFAEGAGAECGDIGSINLRFADGSIGAVHYLANGSKSFPKERLEVFCGGAVLQLDNFRKLRGFGWPGFRTMSGWRQDKGHRAEMKALVSTIQEGKPSPIPFDEIVEVTQVSIDLAREGRFPVSDDRPDKGET